MLKKHSKASKLLTVFIALTFLVSMTGSAFAATVHVGSVGFETDMLDNDLAYLGGFQSYLAGHANDPIIVNAGSGFVFDANAFSNAPEGTSIGDFVADNPVENPPSGNIWDGTGTPGETQPIEADLTAYNAALAAVTEADYTAESWAAYQAIVAANVVTVANTQEEVDAATAAITAAQANLVVKPVALAVESVSAINVNELKVTFNKEVDTAKAVFAVKRGTVTEDVTATWNEAKTEATLKRAVGNFPAAEYTVTVTGLEFAEGKNVGTANVEAEKIESVVIKNESLQIDTNAPVSIGFTNQYGKESTAVTGSQYTLSGYNITTGTSIARVGTAAELASNGMTAGNDVRITVFYNATGKQATKEMKLVPAATVGKVDLGQVVIPTGKDRLTPAGTKNVEVTYTAQNTLGETYKLAATDVGTTTQAVKVFSSKATVIDPAKVTVNASNKIIISDFAGAGTTTLTFLVQATGYTSTLAITVEENEGAAYEVTLAESAAQFAANSTTPIYVGVTVNDKYGKVLTPAQVAAAYTANQIVVFFDDTTTLTSAAIHTTTDANLGKLIITPKAVAKDKNANVTVRVVSSNKQASVQVTAAAAAVPTTIETAEGTTVNTTMMTGGTQAIKFDVKDQYGTKRTDSGTAAYEVRYSTSNTAAVTLNNTTADAIATASTTGKVMTAVAAGTSVVKATLWDVAAATAIAEKAYTITVTSSSTTDTTYYIEDIPTLYAKLAVTDTGSADAETEAARSAGYAKEIVVKATTPQGTVTVPTSKIVNVSTNNADVVTRLMSTGKYFISTNNATGLITAPATTGTAILTVVVNADDNVVTLTKDITVSNAAPVAQTVAWKDAKANVDAAATAKAVTALPDLVGAPAFTGDIKGTATPYLWVQDQYSGYYLSDTDGGSVAGHPQVANTVPALTIAPVSGITVGTATAALTGTQDGKITVSTGTAAFTADNAEYRVIAIKDGKTAFLTGKVLDNTAPTATLTAPTAGAKTSLVVTFNEVLNATTLAIDDINDLLASANNDADGTPAAISVASAASSVVWDTTNASAPKATITIPSTTFVTDQTVSLNFKANAVKDVAGNAILATTEVKATVE